LRCRTAPHGTARRVHVPYKLEFYDADTDIPARMSVSVSASWNASLCVCGGAPSTVECGCLCLKAGVQMYGFATCGRVSKSHSLAQTNTQRPPPSIASRRTHRLARATAVKRRPTRNSTITTRRLLKFNAPANQLEEPEYIPVTITLRPLGDISTSAKHISLSVCPPTAWTVATFYCTVCYCSAERHADILATILARM